MPLKTINNLDWNNNTCSLLLQVCIVSLINNVTANVMAVRGLSIHFTNAMFFLCHEPYTEICRSVDSGGLYVRVRAAVTVWGFSCPWCVALHMSTKKGVGA